jgi:hypothetical protein
MITLAKAIKEYLVLRSIVTNDSQQDWFCTIAYLPDGNQTRDNIATITDTEGMKDGRIMVSGETIIHPGFQVRIRSTDYTTGYQKIYTVAKELDKLLNFAVTIDNESLLVVSVSQQGGILPMGIEPNGRRYHFAINYNGTVKRSNKL